MRITGGKARGIPLKSAKASLLRPATDAMREALFNYLGDSVQGARVLDGFAGVGSYGLEALSRGAARADFIEKNRKLAGCIEANGKAVCKSAELEGGVYKVYSQDFFRFQGTRDGYDLVIIDPPYELFESEGVRILEHARGLLKEGAESCLVLECAAGSLVPDADGLEVLRTLGKKNAGPKLTIFGLR